MSGEVDTVKADGKWTFDEEVTGCFDNMLQRSIPQYEIMRALCFQIGASFVRPNTDILDLGCSRGEALAPFVDKFGAYNHYIGVDCSEPMLAEARKRFEGLISTRLVDIRSSDLRVEFPAAKASLVLCVLTLQFTPLEYRQSLLRKMCSSLLPGGALILVEKLLGEDATTDELLVSNYLKLKAAQGYSEEEINRKKLSLEGVLVPLTAKWNDDALRSAGFGTVECFWRYLNFAGFVAIKS